MKEIFTDPNFTIRISNLIDEQKLTPRQFAIMAKIDISNFGKKVKGQLAWTINDVNKICSTFNVSQKWLIDGEGDIYTDAVKKEPDNETKPLLPTTASAGSLSEYIDGVLSYQCDKMPIIQRFPTYDFTMIIKGNSMEPKYEGGDEIACKRVYDVIEWGKTYVLDTEDGAVIKRVYDADDKIRCVSYNHEEYPDFYIEKQSIRGIYKVVGLIRI